MQIRVLGTLEVHDGERVVALPRRQQRALLAALALRAGEVVSTDRLVAELWGEQAPASAVGSLQNTVAGLRKLLGRDTLVTQPPGYRLAVPPEAVDANRFEQLLTDARGAEPGARARLLREALALWRGPALAGLEDAELARLEAPRLEELRVTALEERIDAELELGRHAALVAELEQLVALHPQRERPHGQLMLALYRCGRQAEALEVYRAFRLILADELALDPSAELRELERKILVQDPELAPPAGSEDSVPTEEAAERLLVTVLAAKPPRAEDPEEHRRRLDETLAAVREVLDRHGGVLERFGPEGLVAFFGSAGPSDDDAVRAVRAARELGLPAGVATGEVVQGAGAVVNRAVALAHGRGIALDERTQSLVGATRRLDAPLVGRVEELVRLRTAFGAARDAGRCTVVTVAGEPGVGKTRLARELGRDEEEHATVLLARCAAHGQGAALLPLVEMLRRFRWAEALEHEPDRELVRERLRALVEGGRAPLGESYWAVRRLLETLARTHPVLLVLDDVHWAGAALLDLIDYLAERIEAPLFVLCLARPELERRPGEALELGPLQDDEARAIVAGTADLDEETRERIVELAEGNPLYAEQLATFAAEGGEGLPPTLEAVLAGRLGRLDRLERTVLQRAAVVGRDFSRSTVAALAGEDVSGPLLALSRAGFIHPAATPEPGDDGYTFHHALLRDAAYASLTKADRANLHERLANFVDRDDALVGYHLEQAARLRRELGEDADELATKAGERLGSAGLQVSRTNDTAAAVGLMTRATALLPPGRRRGELLWELSVALRAAGAAEESTDALQRAEADALAHRDHALRARVSAEAAWVKLGAGQLPLDEAVAEIAAAAARLEQAGDERGLGRALLAAAAVHMFGCNYTELETAAAEAAEHYARAGASPAACVGAQAEAIYLGPTPVPEAKLRCAELLESAPDRVTAALVSAVLGALHALGGDVDEGRTLVDDARALFEDVGSHFAAATTLAPLAFDVEVCAGEADTAEAIARGSFELLQAGGPVNHAYSTSRALELAELLLDEGRWQEAEPLVDFAEEHAVASDVYVQFLWRSAKARVLVRKGEHSSAEELARQGAALSVHTDGLRDRTRTHLALAEVLRLGGRTEEELREREEARRLLRAKGATALLAALGADSLVS